MWRLGFCALALLATPALAQTLQYDDDHTLRRHQHASSGLERLHHARRHPVGLTSRTIEPSLLGPAPTGFWYRCDMPAGYYPYIPTCQTPWRMVPSMPPR